MEMVQKRSSLESLYVVHIHTIYRLMCAQRFQKPLNLDVRHPEIIHRRNACTGWRDGGWQRSALLSTEDSTYTRV